MTEIHSTAIVSGKAQLGENVTIGPFVFIEDDVEIGDNSIIGPHACIYNGARLGKNVKIFQSASVSNAPQDLKFADEKTYFYVGDNTVIRESVTLHKGTKETGFSRIGNNCLLMAYAHVAHDCTIGDNCILANAVQVGGHVEIENQVIIGGATSVHQFSKVGQHAMVGGGFRIIADIPPFVLAAGEPIKYAGLNIIGLRRRGFSNEEISTLKNAYNILYNSGKNFSEAKLKLKETFAEHPRVNNILDFLAKSNRGIIRR
ncbi:MAG: acyl-[acyl-carrier-protein]--UDP-N-acetylglucosamine O-acyltransferase [Ignavibacteriae bacterium HGW-Ignavibacteriae-2]|jgi:UDP-N-acetylglucosamine acyltransferase|nr:acyl-ACP--UDP-N-acetylglucosamine O-acyltransferase [Bacteroidota bacterium]PKL89142.1 MAG: acyl-[acyl-carrier-protein]--UDP-N-acetylglucosamine O-acyltransferase [Ignavibacteriae bacterium HGW-Ignavibacteriae-2]